MAAKNLLLLRWWVCPVKQNATEGIKRYKKEAKTMIREIKFIVTGEIRKPKGGDWFLNTQNSPICAAQDFNTTKFPILKMEIIEDTDTKPDFMPICVRK